MPQRQRTIVIWCDVCGKEERTGRMDFADTHMKMRAHVRTEHPDAGSGYGWTDMKVGVREE